MDNNIITAMVAAIASFIIAVFGAVLTYFSTRKNQKDLANLEATLNKVERLEGSRSEGYENIWNLTGSLNLFGPTVEPDIEDLSANLKDWYFKHGLVLGEDSKKRYFLVQEILNFGKLRSASFSRPADSKIFGDKKHPVQVLNDLRLEFFGIKAYRVNIIKIEEYVSNWKMEHNHLQAEKNWVLLQYILSEF